MESVSCEERRLQRSLTRYLRAPSVCWDDVVDPRGRRGRRWQLGTLLNALFVGVLACCRALRDVEALSAQMVGRGGLGRSAPRRVPDTTLDGLLRKADPAPFVAKIHAQVREMKRHGQLEPMVGLPCGVASIDGKTLATMDREANAYCQHKTQQGGPDYWLQRAVRVVLTSSETRVCIHQRMIPAETNDMGIFEAAYADLLAAFGDADLFRIVTADAGFTSQHNADLVAASGRYYLFALKDNQPTLLAEAQRVFLAATWAEQAYEPAARTDWEKRAGKWWRRSLWRTQQMRGASGWSHLEQVLMVVLESRDGAGRVSVVETRFFVSSVPTDLLTPLQLLHVVRGHWGIENDCFWSLDAQWKEDHGAWCTQNDAVEILGLLRLLAYNVLQQLRKRHMPGRAADGQRRPPTRWQELFDRVRAVLLLNTTMSAAAVLRT